MNMVDFLKKELQGWGKIERIIFPAEIILIAIISIYIHDSKVALVSAICGICATILAGKGKISCYIFGMVANICYSYISYKNGFWGNLCLNMLYYFPMQFVGIFQWKNHLKKESQEIYKSELSKYERFLYLAATIILSICAYFIILKYNGSNPIFDSITTVCSIVALILTIKRCIEQWYIWTVVNSLCVLMWINAYIHGSNCFATILMWSTYLVLGIYFLCRWRKELSSLQ